MDTGLIVTFVGIIVAGLAGILGVWLERDRTAPPGWAYVFTALIVLATGLKVAHSIFQKAESGQKADAVARVLERLVVLSESGTNPALDQFVGAELAVQAARENPEVMERLEVSVEEKGGDPTALRRKASAARRAAAGLPPRSKTGKGLKATKATKLGKAVEELLEPLDPEAEGEVPEIPELPVDLPSIPGIGEPEVGDPEPATDAAEPATDAPEPATDAPEPEPVDAEEGKEDKAGKAGKGGKNR